MSSTAAGAGKCRSANIARACCGRWAADRTRFALYWEDESGARAAYSFWDIQQAANRLSNALAGLGVQRGDRVAIILPQRPETAIAYIAIFQMGAIEGHAQRIDPEGKQVHFGDGRSLEYDTLSINIGALPGFGAVHGAREHAVGAKPFARLLAASTPSPRAAAGRPRAPGPGAGRIGSTGAGSADFVEPLCQHSR